MANGFVVADARRGFALGLAAGLAFASAAFIIYGKVALPAEGTAARTQRDASTAPWHAGVAEGSLSAAIRASARLLPGAGAVTARPAAAQSPTGEVADLLARAEEHRRKREFAQACALYASVVARGGMTADGWADYADAQSSVDGRIAGEPARYIAAALALEPQHPKALWLHASLAHEERRYSDALATWRRLQAVVPPGSSDARIVEANIAEAARLARS
jgi:cytochrome c-type biogenesis protein CcmH